MTRWIPTDPDRNRTVNHNAPVKQRVREFHRRIAGARSEPSGFRSTRRSLGRNRESRYALADLALTLCPWPLRARGARGRFAGWPVNHTPPRIPRRGGKLPGRNPLHNYSRATSERESPQLVAEAWFSDLDRKRPIGRATRARCHPRVARSRFLLTTGLVFPNWNHSKLLVNTRASASRLRPVFRNCVLALPESNPLHNSGRELARRERCKWLAFNGLCVFALHSGLGRRSQVRNPEQGPESNRLLTRVHFFERFETAPFLLTGRERSRGDRDAYAWFALPLPGDVFARDRGWGQIDSEARAGGCGDSLLTP